jgi:hypothetical protein
MTQFGCSSKACMCEFFSVGYLDDVQMSLLLQMVDDRNLETYTYHESLTDEIFAHIEMYLELLEKVYHKMNI